MSGVPSHARAAPPHRLSSDLCYIGEDEEEVVQEDQYLDLTPFRDKICAVATSSSPSARDVTYCQDMEVNEERLRGGRYSDEVHLTPEELLQLRDLQHHIAVHDDAYDAIATQQRAEAEEGVRKQRVDGIHRQMKSAARRARVDSDQALGTLLSKSVRAQQGIVNSLLATDAAFSIAAQVERAARAEGWDLDNTQEETGQEVDDDDECCGDDDECLALSPAKPSHDALFTRRCAVMARVVDEKLINVEECGYVRKPNLAKLIQQRDDDAARRGPKFTMKALLTSRRFHLYKHRFANAQYKHGLRYPTLPQPADGRSDSSTEMVRTRRGGHRFIIAADTQFGILMDGYAMENPNWSDEVEMSRQCVADINAMKGSERPLFVCMCGDLVDTESSFSHALASWKKIMAGWERTLVFEQQVKDFKRVWGQLDDDIALVCLCGNHDVGNRPTKSSIEHWTSQFGDDYLAFWANGTYNICLNNCLFSDPTGAPDLFEEQLVWLEERLMHANENDASHIFIYSHFPWFLKHEDETDEEVTSHSECPPGWGPQGTKFPDSYFTIPLEERQMALMLFRKYGVTACFSGHFHQNVVAKASWGMDMIVTGPLSMTLKSTIHKSLSDEPIGVGMRVVDVGERGEFKHEFRLLCGEENLTCQVCSN